MLRDLYSKYRLDALIIFILSTAAWLTSIYAHAAMKPVTRMVGYIGPVVFTAALIALIAVVDKAKRSPSYAWACRLLCGVSIASVTIFIALFKAETIYAPIEWAQGTDAQTVVERIALNEDVARFKAWSRLASMSRDEKDAVAREMAQLLTSENEAARESAALTLAYPLRRHTMAALDVLAPEIQDFLSQQGGSEVPSTRAIRAASFAQGFVASSYKSILKALGPKNRDKLPEGGIHALLLALATEERIGHAILRGFASEGDDVLRPAAGEVLTLTSTSKS